METLTSVLDVSQLKAGTIELNPSRCDVTALARDAVNMFQQSAAQKGIALSLTEGQGEIPAHLDTAALGRVLTNLVSNAVKFTEQGRVKIGVAQAGRQVHITVCDTGKGIEADFLPHLFDEFRQESSGLSRRFEGNGLGLAISKELVQLMGGSIHVESTPGRGTTFEVRLPVGLVAPADVRAPLAAATPAPERARLLIVEDNEPTRVLLSILLGKRFDLTLAGGVREALAVAGETAWAFDLVLLDINLGEGGSGLDLLPELRKMSEGWDTQFMAMTAYALPGDAERLLEAGFDWYLGKPFTKSELEDAMTVALGARATRAGHLAG